MGEQAHGAGVPTETSVEKAALRVGEGQVPNNLPVKSIEDRTAVLGRWWLAGTKIQADFL